MQAANMLFSSVSLGELRLFSDEALSVSLCGLITCFVLFIFFRKKNCEFQSVTVEISLCCPWGSKLRR